MTPTELNDRSRQSNPAGDSIPNIADVMQKANERIRKAFTPSGHLADLEALYTEAGKVAASLAGRTTTAIPHAESETAPAARTGWFLTGIDGAWNLNVDGGTWVVEQHEILRLNDAVRFISTFSADDFSPSRPLITDSLTLADAKAKCEMTEREFQAKEAERRAVPTDAEKLARLLQASRTYCSFAEHDDGGAAHQEMLEAIEFAEQTWDRR